MKLPGHRNTLLSHTVVFVSGAALSLAVFHSATESGDHPGREGHPGGSTGGSGSGRATAGGTSGRLHHGQTEGKVRGAGRQSQPAAARLAGIIRMGDPLARQVALLQLLERLEPDEFAAVADTYRSLDHFGQSGGEFDLILRSWAKMDPMAALDYTINRQQSRGATAVVLAAWAGNDAAAAESWALGNHSGEGPNPYLGAVISGIAAYDPANATRLAGSLPAGREQRDAVRDIARALLVQGFDIATSYPQSIADPKLRAVFVEEIGGRLAEKSPDKAGEWLVSLNNAEDQNRAARQVGDALASRDPQAAAKWIDKLQPAARAEAARGIIPRMSSGDIPGTAKWVNTLAGIPNYDRVVEEYVWSCDYRAPEQSAAWIRGVSDQERQTKLYHQMLGEWAKRDAAAVKSWVASNQVPESVMRRFGR